jgi:hypothetical protein
MAMFWSILGLRTNLIDGKCCPFNGEMDNVLSLGSKIYFWMISNDFSQIMPKID